MDKHMIKARVLNFIKKWISYRIDDFLENQYLVDLLTTAHSYLYELEKEDKCVLSHIVNLKKTYIQKAKSKKI